MPCIHKTRGGRYYGPSVCACLLCCEIRPEKVGDGGGERDRVRTIKEIINYKMKFAKNHLPQEYESVVYAGR